MDVTIDDGFRVFICNFYTEALAGMLINLFQSPDIGARDKLLEYLSVILYNSIPSVLSAQPTSK